MFSQLEHYGKVTVADAAFSWNRDLDLVFEIISRHFGSFNENGFYAHPEEVAIREALRGVDTLCRLTDTLLALPSNGVILRNVGLAGLPEDRRNAALYAITLMLGFPTSTDQRTGRVAWDVKARPVDEDDQRFVTFSERIGSADMHTDSSFYPMPEEKFILYVVTAARCDGGHTLLVDAESVNQALQETQAGRMAYALLRTTPVPFRVPSVYAAADAAVEYYVAPVLGDPGREDERFRLRWRYDAIKKGWSACPHLSTPELLDALEVMNQVAERDAVRFKEQLPTDTLMLADNHRMLHGRTTYTDERRHLIRIRMSDAPNSQRIGPSGVVRD
jgi:alpha-ketoglutarate-dependent taurine dioxygenase